MKQNITFPTILKSNPAQIESCSKAQASIAVVACLLLYLRLVSYRKPKSPSKVCTTGLTNNQDFDLHYSVGSRNQLTTVLKFFFLLYYEKSNSISVSESVFPRVETTFPTVQFTSADVSRNVLPIREARRKHYFRQSQVRRASFGVIIAFSLARMPSPNRRGEETVRRNETGE